MGLTADPIATTARTLSLSSAEFRNPQVHFRALSVGQRRTWEGESSDRSRRLRPILGTPLDEIRDGIKLLAECEGIFAETAGGVTVGVAKKLIASGAIPANDSAVLCITGNGLKTLDAVVGHAGYTREIRPSLREFEALLEAEAHTPAHA